MGANRCKGLTHGQDQKVAAVLEMQSGHDANKYHVYLLLFDGSTGDMESAQRIDERNFNGRPYISPQGIAWSDADNYYFTGHSKGFETKY